MRLIKGRPTITHFRGHPPTVATFVFELGERGQLKFGYSLCSPKDQFSRKKGREKAFERLASAPEFLEVTLEKGVTWAPEGVHDEIELSKLNTCLNAIETLYTLGKLPRRVSKIWAEVRNLTDEFENE